MHGICRADQDFSQEGANALNTTIFTNILKWKNLSPGGERGWIRHYFHVNIPLLSDISVVTRLLEGGADTGFRHVEPKEYKPRLLHFHGKGQ